VRQREERERDKGRASEMQHLHQSRSVRDKKRDRGKRQRARQRSSICNNSEMQHLQQSTSFHYTPAVIHYLPSHAGRETESETEGERARCSICNNLVHSITLLPKSFIYLLMEGGRQRARQRESERDAASALI